MVRVGLIKVKIKQRLEGGEGANQGANWGKSISGRRKRIKALRGSCLVYLRLSKEASEAERVRKRSRGGVQKVDEPRSVQIT